MTAKEFGERMYAAIQAKHKKEEALELQKKIDSHYQTQRLDRFMRATQRKYYSQMHSSRG